MIRLAGVRRLPGAIELPLARRRRLRAERRTWVLGAGALTLTGLAVLGELGRVWARGSAPLPTAPEEVLEAGAEAARQTVEVAVEGYRAGSVRENALLNLLVSFSLTFASARALTWGLRARGGRLGPFRNVRVGSSHIHHFVPGIALAFAAGGTAVLSRNEKLDPLLAVPFGAGVALTLDESALLLKLDDVYWSEEGIVSVQISFVVLAMASAVACASRMLRRGERTVLDEPLGSPA